MTRASQANGDADAMAHAVVAQVFGLEQQKPALLNMAASTPDRAEAIEAQLAALDAEIGRLRAVQAARSDRARNDRQIVVQLRDAMARWGSGTRLVPAASPAAVASTGGPGEIVRLRQQIDTLKDEREHIIRAPLPREELRARATAAVDALAESGVPKLDVERGRFGIKWIPDGASLMHVVAFIVAHDRANVLAALHRAIDIATAGEPGIADADRARKLADLDRRILELERREEAAIEATPEIARRPDADPRAVLGGRGRGGGSARGLMS
jgi:hypothetical protein